MTRPHSGYADIEDHGFAASPADLKPARNEGIFRDRQQVRDNRRIRLFKRRESKQRIDLLEIAGR